MPPSVILITHNDLSLDKIDEQLSLRFTKLDRLPDRLVVRLPQGYVAINCVPSAVEHYDFEELDVVKASVPEPLFFSVEYHDVTLLKAVLSVVCEGRQMLVDDDDGVICPCSAFWGNL